MKNSAIVVFVFFMLMVVSFRIEADSRKSSSIVGVDIELEEMPKVMLYEIEVQSITTKKEKIQKFSQQNFLFHLKLNVGNYQMRTRIITDRAQMGPWSDWTELLARPEGVEQLVTTSYNRSLRKDRGLAEVDLSWQKANGADNYVVWIEDLIHKKMGFKETQNSSIKLNLKLGEYKIGVQSVSKDRIRSEVRYFDNTFLVAKTKLPAIKLDRPNVNNFQWLKQKEADVKIEIYRKSFFGDKFIKIYTSKESGLNWHLPIDLKPGEYKIDFQYISEAFENGPIQRIGFVKRPGEKDFANSALSN